MLDRVEAVKLAQAALGDFLTDTRVRELKGERDDNKEVYFVIKFLTVPHTINLIFFWRNSPHCGHGLLILEVSRSHSTTHHSR